LISRFKNSRGRGVVPTAEVRISDDDDFVGRLLDMRVWLDDNQFQPSTFTYFYLDPGMMIRVRFDSEEEAAAFAHEFGGCLLDPQTAPNVLALEFQPGGPNARAPDRRAG
jgi:hypothetical protein